MEKEIFIKKLGLILESFDQNKNADMEIYIDRIQSACETYSAGIIEAEREKAVKDFLTKQLNLRK